MKTTKRSLLASGLAVLVCIAMLAGTTFAWFTDSVVNKGNKIQSGSLSIDAYAYDLDKDGTGGFTIEGVNGGKPFTFEEEGQDLKKDPSPILNETLWEPGKSSAKLLKVQNNGTLAAKIKLEFALTDGGLQDALWFDFVQVKDGQVTGQFTKRPMSELATIAQNLELPVLAGQNVQFILVYGMNEEAGNEYQDKSFSADIMIQATQYTEEEDGFGNPNYDADAQYAVPVSTEAELRDAITSGESVSLTKDITLTERIKSTEDIIIQGNGYTIDTSTISSATDGILISGATDPIKVELSGVDWKTSSYNRSAIGFGDSNIESIEINNCSFDGYKYGIWVAQENTVKEVHISNSQFSAWCPFYFYSSDCEITFDNCILDGHNKHSGTTNAFATVAVEGGAKIGNVTGSGTGNNNVLTFNNCTLRASNSGDQPQYILSFNYGASNNTTYFNNCVIEQNSTGYVFGESSASENNRVFQDGKELTPNE
ncbi:pectate lyase-like adhesive domain-containing protein [Solibaculum mannosilyticum]|uniref:pectate lyase-like adhesive domain-containing protein n=1 Tax=Solibaculum mannosilyticum TaxID=2780922 RepID=UPI0034AFE8BE